MVLESLQPDHYLSNIMFGKNEAHQLCIDLIRKYFDTCQSILEVGSGNGELLRKLSAIYHAFSCGIDPKLGESDEGLIHFRPLSAEELDKLSGKLCGEINLSFDLIYSVHSLHHFGNPKAFFRGVKHRLKKNGKLILVDWRKGAITGIPEEYYGLDEVAEWVERSRLHVIEKGIKERHFYLIATSGRE